jgi:hypothetical protein
MTQARNASMALTGSLRRTLISRSIIGTCFLVFVLLLAACGTSTGTSPTPAASTPQQTVSSGPEATLTQGSSTSTSADGYPVKVYFSKFPDSLNNFNAVFPVDRSSPSIAVATFSIQLLIAGPTLSELSAGYFSEFNSILTGPSSCSAPHPTGGPDFTLTLNRKGSKSAPGTATLRLCRASQSPGVGADARILAEINATLKQFSNIKNVVVLTQAGQCFGDESGKNLCLK